MRNDAALPVRPTTIVGWLLLGLAIVVWLAGIPVSGAAFAFASRITVEPALATIAALIYGVIGGLGLSFIAASRHRSACRALWVYGVLLAFAVLVAVALGVHSGHSH